MALLRMLKSQTQPGALILVTRQMIKELRLRWLEIPLDHLDPQCVGTLLQIE
jgi:hypothetical protein